MNPKLTHASILLVVAALSAGTVLEGDRHGDSKE